MPNIKKGRIVFEFMYDADLTPDAEVRGMSIDDILTETDSGIFIGHGEPLEITEVPQDEVKPLLLAWANDGTFFNDEV